MPPPAIPEGGEGGEGGGDSGEEEGEDDDDGENYPPESDPVGWLQVWMCNSSKILLLNNPAATRAARLLW